MHSFVRWFHVRTHFLNCWMIIKVFRVKTFGSNTIIILPTVYFKVSSDKWQLTRLPSKSSHDKPVISCKHLWGESSVIKSFRIIKSSRIQKRLLRDKNARGVKIKKNFFNRKSNTLRELVQIHIRFYLKLWSDLCTKLTIIDIFNQTKT